MKILKYFLLLIILFFTTSTVFIATLKPVFKTENSQLINMPRAKVFNYINDFKKWESFDFGKENDASILYNFIKKTGSKNSSFTWKTNGKVGVIETVFVKNQEKIVQKINLNGEISNLIWTFKDTLGKTKLSMQSNGILSFENKMLSRFSGGMEAIIESKNQKILALINKNLDFEINVHNILVDGYLQKNGCFYLHKTITSKNDKMAKNIQILISELVAFFKKNNLNSVASPFVIYNSFDNAAQTTNFSVCIATTKALFLANEDAVLSGQLFPFQSVKVTLKGDYSHFSAVKSKATSYFLQNNLIEDPSNKYIEVYLKSKKEIKNPSKWVTTFYFPAKIKTKYIPIKKVQDSIPKVESNLIDENLNS